MNITLNNSYLTRVLSKIQKLNYRDLIIFLIPLVIFGYYLYVFNPGIIYWDSYYQLHQIATNHFDNWHPFFHTFIEMVCLKIWPNPLLISILQITTFSTMWMIMCKYLRDDNSKNNKLFILQVIFSLIISLIPLNATHSILLYKDILFSYFLMFLCFLIKVLLDKKGKVSLTFLVVLAIVMSFVAQLRPNGIYIALILLAVFIIYFFKNNRKQKFHILIPILTITFILLISSLNVVYDVEDYQKDAVLSKTVHMLSDYDLNLNLNKNDKEKLHELISEDSIKEKYEITFSDPIYKSMKNQSAYENDKGTYLFMAIKYSLKNPGHFIKYLFKSSPSVWKIVRGEDWVHCEGLGTHIKPTIREAYYDYIKESPMAGYDNATYKNIGTQQYNNLESFIRYVASDKLLDTLFDSPALYMYLSLIILGLVYSITRSKDLLLVYLPNMINIVIVFFSTPAPQLRYLYPNFLVFYLLVLIIFEMVSKYHSQKI